MKVDEFVDMVTGEPPKIVLRSVASVTSEVLTKVASPGGMSMLEFLSAKKSRSELREIHYCHILGAPISDESMTVWKQRWPSHPLPNDLQELLFRFNGVHLWANRETGRSYLGLAPIEEWDLARIKMYGHVADQRPLDDRFLAISYHQDGAEFIVLDVVSGEYYLMDSAGPDKTCAIGGNVEDLLEWLWKSRIVPDP